jgi:hypothetical protein
MYALMISPVSGSMTVAGSPAQSYEKRKVMRSIFCFLYFSFCFLISLLITYFFKYYF